MVASESSASASLFPPIADYGFLSNCEQSCLVAPDGSVEWLCLPRPDSPSVFGALLDRTAGLFRFGPGSTNVPQHRRYVPGTMVLETTWQTPTGWMTVHDLLAVGPVKQRRVRTLARAWLAEQRFVPPHRLIRFDAVGVSFDPGGKLIELEHLRDAF